MTRLPRYPGFAGPRPAGGPIPSAEKPSGYAEKLVKYVPAEVVAGWVPLYTLVRDGKELSKEASWGLLALGVVSTLVYSAVRVRKENAATPPWYFWVFSVLAFLAWAAATTAIGTDLFGLSPRSVSIGLGAIVFLLPGIDQLLTPRPKP